MVRRGTGLGSATVLALAGAVACSDADSSPPSARRPVPVTTMREASEFACVGDRCVQRHPRLPDTGEWRCAEREGVAWCAGGEPAAGVVALPKERGFVCGERRKSERGRRERVCVDAAPDYPGGRAGEYSCRFTERGGRECVRQVVPVRPLARAGTPDCWIDADCGGARCDRGTCAEPAP